MPHKIKGNIGEAGRVLIFDESDFNTVEVNEVVSESGAFDIEVPSSGVKMVLARSASGEVIGYGMTSSIFEAPSEFTQSFGHTVYYANAAGYQYTNSWNGTNTVIYCGYQSGRFYQGYCHLPNVTIAKNSTIHSAIFRARVNSNGGNVSASAKMFDAADATYIYSSPDYAQKPKTSGISFTMSAGGVGGIYSFPDMASEVQKVVNRADWVSGNDMGFFFRGSGKLVGFTSYRGAEDNGYYWPNMEINWTVPG
jgi:hypothetical protein